MVNALLNRTKILIFDWIFKFLTLKMCFSSHGQHGLLGSINTMTRNLDAKKQLLPENDNEYTKLSTLNTTQEFLTQEFTEITELFLIPLTQVFNSQNTHVLHLCCLRCVTISFVNAI